MKLVLLGGFLGSGKTTAIVGACQLLMTQGKKVAVITNDQGDQQVDTAFVKSFGIPAEEVANGCFCCNYNQLDAHLESLIKQHKPDVMFAESVGSCTDLIATIAKPLNELRPELRVVISVFADAELLSSIMEGHSSFLEDSVRYIYKKQLEEADVLILSKADTLSEKQLKSIQKTIALEYPGKIMLLQNSLAAEDISKWLQTIEQFNELHKRNSLSLDYDIYGDGEAQLAWLDKSVTINTGHDNAIFIAHKIIGSVFDAIQQKALPIGHLKFFLEAGDWNDKISFTTTSTNSNIPKQERNAAIVKLLINARVQTAPLVLQTLIDDVVSKAENLYGCKITPEKWKVFKPGYPRPTHRVA